MNKSQSHEIFRLYQQPGYTNKYLEENKPFVLYCTPSQLLLLFILNRNQRKAHKTGSHAEEYKREAAPLLYLVTLTVTYYCTVTVRDCPYENGHLEIVLGIRVRDLGFRFSDINFETTVYETVCIRLQHSSRTLQSKRVHAFKSVLN